MGHCMWSGGRGQEGEAAELEDMCEILRLLGAGGGDERVQRDTWD